ncbi:MAG: hypothetical protein JSW43_01600, partial [Gemmatimonadota bacterium]
EYAAPGESTRWTAFDQADRMIAALETPPGFLVFEIGPDWVLGRIRDELDVEQVQLYGVMKE